MIAYLYTRYLHPTICVSKTAFSSDYTTAVMVLRLECATHKSAGRQSHTVTVVVFMSVEESTLIVCWQISSSVITNLLTVVNILNTRSTYLAIPWAFDHMCPHSQERISRHFWKCFDSDGLGKMRQNTVFTPTTSNWVVLSGVTWVRCKLLWFYCGFGNLGIDGSDQGQVLSNIFSADVTYSNFILIFLQLGKND